MGSEFSFESIQPDQRPKWYLFSTFTCHLLAETATLTCNPKEKTEQESSLLGLYMAWVYTVPWHSLFFLQRGRTHSQWLHHMVANG